jgi:hypothetical protein
VGGIAQALDRLVPGGGIAIGVGEVVGDHHPATGAHDPRHLLQDPPRRWDVVQAEAVDGAVEAGVLEVQGGCVAE